MAQLIQNRASVPLRVVPTSYPAPPLNQLGAAVLGYMQMFLIGIVLMGSDALLPEYVKENKMACCFALFLGVNMFSSAMTKSNAFEIYVGKDLIWSTLSSQRTPNLKDIVDGFASVGVKITT
mmetsp:Transcript_28264/g.51019  ORF Transcript_28264/g.51019 Transcript_28264/m.51019 type:complete len:122 (-) Transcript_28264:23-388(-)